MRTSRFRPFALLGIVLLGGGCDTRPASDESHSGWALLGAAPDSVLLDTARVEWLSSDARVWLRTRVPVGAPPGESAVDRVATLETRRDISCARSEVRDLEIRTLDVAGAVVRDSVVAVPSWIPASAHPAFHPLFPALCTQLSRLHPRGLHNLLGSDRP